MEVGAQVKDRCEVLWQIYLFHRPSKCNGSDKVEHLSLQVRATGSSRLCRALLSSAITGQTSTVIHIEMSKRVSNDNDEKTHHKRTAAVLESFYNYYTFDKTIHEAANVEEATFLHGLATRSFHYLLCYAVASGVMSKRLPLVLEAQGKHWTMCGSGQQDHVNAIRLWSMQKLMDLYARMSFKPTETNPVQLESALRKRCVRMESRVGPVLRALAHCTYTNHPPLCVIHAQTPREAEVDM